MNETIEDVAAPVISTSPRRLFAGCPVPLIPRMPTNVGVLTRLDTNDDRYRSRFLRYAWMSARLPDVGTSGSCDRCDGPSNIYGSSGMSHRAIHCSIQPRMSFRCLSITRWYRGLIHPFATKCAIDVSRNQQDPAGWASSCSRP